LSKFWGTKTSKDIEGLSLSKKLVPVIFHKDFYQVYTSDPAAASGRMEAIIAVIDPRVRIVNAEPASVSDIAAVHSSDHIDRVRHGGLYAISALAAGGAIQAAQLGLVEPTFGLIRPPGHHASADSSWGFCYFNNMAIAMEALKRTGKIKRAYVLDIDLHYGDGTVNILERKDYVTIYNPEGRDRETYLKQVAGEMEKCAVDLIGISAGFDNHLDDWGGLLRTEDYREIGRMVREAAQRCKAGCFGILEGGYNHTVLGHNIMALLEGFSGQ
jgi:acetoin utilization deacetylase AcuC-like enzyme